MDLNDTEACYRAVSSRDARFDGYFYVCVTTTRIYCRPSCPARTPAPTNVRFTSTAAAAQTAGFRACKRCRPDATPGSPQWNTRGDLAARAMRLIADGTVDREGVAGLADRLGYSERQVHRCLTAELGASPVALARTQRAHTARLLIETTDMPFTALAFAAGFASIRQFNDTIRDVYATTPSELRDRSPHHRSGAPGDARSDGQRTAITIRLPFRKPFDGQQVLNFLAPRCVPGIEEVVDGTYRRTLRLPYGTGIASLSPTTDYVRCDLLLDDLRDLATAIDRCRRLFDLDADPVAVDGILGRDELLRPLVDAQPGLRVPGHVDGNELAVRALLGQQVSVAGAATLAGRLVAASGEPLRTPDGGLTHHFPTADAIASLSPEAFAMPRARGRALIGLAAHVANGHIVIGPGADRDELVRQLVALPGIGPWTASYIQMRALGDPDTFLPTDLGVRHALDGLGVASSPDAAAAFAERWRPWRSYALMHLWSSLTPPAISTPNRTATKGARS